ncbi:WD40 repeat-like protein [Rickenella mellea]|uniref:Peroxin-7 n=1 Tax=Rickenella mellea TaxID=50990 RepID=A0A4Y7QFZ4_9AGAM|nr:WD40 repeat-like protein [Rickenella mellea]
MNHPGPPPPSTLHTPGFAHYSLAWSPFHTSRLAIASSANYGLVGNGRLHLATVLPPGVGLAGPPPLNLDKFYATQDGLYDVAWSEIHENQLVSASGDGTLRLWDVTLNDLPIKSWHEHTREVFSVDWSNVNKELFASASWDGLVKIYTPTHSHSLTTLHAHSACIYQALFSPHHQDLIATTSADGCVKIFDLRLVSSSLPNTTMTSSTGFNTPLTVPALTIPPTSFSGGGGGMGPGGGGPGVGGGEVLTIDWNKYRPFVLASAGVDKVIRVWDCRMVKTGPQPTSSSESTASGGQILYPPTPTTQLSGHEYAVRKVQWSPHRADVLASASYDMTCRVWSTSPSPPSPQHQNPLLAIHDTHTEFVVGCAWSLYEDGVLASCAWDGRVCVYRG